MTGPEFYQIGGKRRQSRRQGQRKQSRRQGQRSRPRP